MARFESLFLSLGILSGLVRCQNAPYASPAGFSADISAYLEASESDASGVGLARGLLFNNINVPDSANGTVIAAQSYENPDYAYNWVRDAALTMDVVAALYEAATSETARSYYAEDLFAYAGARAQQQNAPDLQTGLGEPKFNLDNTVFTGAWCRPQNDGPATSAATLMRFATAWMRNGESKDAVIKQIYEASVKNDLLFVASNWSLPSCGIWEEVSSHHFYNRAVSHKSLVIGAAFATEMGDDYTSMTLSSAANEVAGSLAEFWNETSGIVQYEVGPVLMNKVSYLDVAVILGVMHGHIDDSLFSYADDQVLSTAHKLAMSFLATYPIAASQQTDADGATLGIPIGRYPEDVYTGTGTAENGGNPWFLATAAISELFYRAGVEIRNAGSLNVTDTSIAFWDYFAPGANLTTASYNSDSDGFVDAIGALQGWADAFIRLIKYHSGEGGHLSEQYSRNTGFMVGAEDLTWSYASLLTAAFARAELQGNSSYVQALADLNF